MAEDPVVNNPFPYITETALKQAQAISEALDKIESNLDGLAVKVEELSVGQAYQEERLRMLETAASVSPDPQMPLPTPDPVVPPLPGVLDPEVVFHEGWDVDALSRYIVEAPASLPGSVSIVMGQLRSVLNTEQTPNRARKYKSEVYRRDVEFTKWTKPVSEPMGVPREYVFSLFLEPKDTKGTSVDWTRIGSRIVLLQLHGIEDEEEKGFGRNPALALSIETKAGKPCLCWRKSWSAEAAQTNNANTSVLWTGPQVVDQQLVVRVRARWSYGSVGYVQIAHRVYGEAEFTVVSETNGPNCFKDLYGPYWSIGQYLPALSSAESASLVNRPREYVVDYAPYTVFNGW
jgi:hypothetical protein